MLRAWSETPLAGSNAEVVLGPEESHHLVKVRRVRADEPVEVLDGRGFVATGRVVDPDARRARVLVESSRFLPRPGPPLVLAVCPVKAGGLDAILASASEIGVDRVVPLVTARTEVRLAKERLPSWRAKVDALLREAAKQCGLPWLPEVDDPVAWEAFLAASDPAACRMVAALDGRRRTPEQVAAALPARPTAWVLAVGPEGDFTPAELGAGREAGFEAVTLGPWVMRVPTAALAGLARIAALR